MAGKRHSTSFAGLSERMTLRLRENNFPVGRVQARAESLKRQSWPEFYFREVPQPDRTLSPLWVYSGERLPQARVTGFGIAHLFADHLNHFSILWTLSSPFASARRDRLTFRGST